MSSSRAGSTFSGDKRARTSALKAAGSMGSGMADPRHAIERSEQRVPAPALAVQHLLAVGGDAIEAAAPRAGAFDPFALDEAATFEAVEGGIERGDVELDRAAGSLLDQLRDLVAVAVAFVDERKDEEFGAAFAQLTLIGHRLDQHPTVLA